MQASGLRQSGSRIMARAWDILVGLFLLVALLFCLIFIDIDEDSEEFAGTGGRRDKKD